MKNKASMIKIFIKGICNLILKLKKDYMATMYIHLGNLKMSLCWNIIVAMSRRVYVCHSYLSTLDWKCKKLIAEVVYMEAVRILA